MGRIFIFVFAIVVLASCNTTKSSTDIAYDSARHTLDSIKYELAKEAFINSEFVFRMNTENGLRISPIDNWIKISGDSIYIQWSYSSINRAPTDTRVSIPSRIIMRQYTISDKKIKRNESRKYTSMSVTARYNKVSNFILTLYDNSNRAYLDWYNSRIEGWIEPLETATNFEGFVLTEDKW